MDLSIESSIELGGRTFVPTPDDEIVFEQFAYIQTAAQEAGLGQELMDAYKPFVEELAGEGAELNESQLAHISEKVIMRAFRGRAYLCVLAGALVEEGQEWSLEAAEQNVEFFKRLKGEDIRKMHTVLTMATIGFFSAGLRSIATSPSSSERKRRLAGHGIDPAKVTLSPKQSPAGVAATESSVNH